MDRVVESGTRWTTLARGGLAKEKYPLTCRQTSRPVIVDYTGEYLLRGAANTVAFLYQGARSLVGSNSLNLYEFRGKMNKTDCRAREAYKTYFSSAPRRRLHLYSQNDGQGIFESLIYHSESADSTRSRLRNMVPCSFSLNRDIFITIHTTNFCTSQVNCCANWVNIIKQTSRPPMARIQLRPTPHPGQYWF